MEKDFTIGWHDVDMNSHTRHDVYLKNSATLRLMWFVENGINEKYLRENHCGPVLVKEYVDYKRETYLLDTLHIKLFLKGVSKDSRRWVLNHDIYNGKEERVAEIFLEGVFIDTITRKIIIPPAKVKNLFQEIKEQGKETVKEISYLKPSLRHGFLITKKRIQ